MYFNPWSCIVDPVLGLCAFIGDFLVIVSRMSTIDDVVLGYNCSYPGKSEIS